MAEKIKVLIVEDEIAIASLYQLALGTSNYEFLETVTTGEESIEAVRNGRPHLIIMDICLAGQIDGIDAAREIIEIDKKIKIIFITGYGDEATKQRIEELGNYPMYSKPVSIAKLRKIIAEQVGT